MKHLGIKFEDLDSLDPRESLLRCSSSFVFADLRRGGSTKTDPNQAYPTEGTIELCGDLYSCRKQND